MSEHLSVYYYLLVLSKTISLFLVAWLCWISEETLKSVGFFFFFTHYFALWTILTVLGPCLNAVLSVLFVTSSTQPRDKIWITRSRTRSSGQTKRVPILRLWLTACENLLSQTSLPPEAWQNPEEEMSISWEGNHYFPPCCHSEKHPHRNSGKHSAHKLHTSHYILFCLISSLLTLEITLEV